MHRTTKAEQSLNRKKLFYKVVYLLYQAAVRVRYVSVFLLGIVVIRYLVTNQISLENITQYSTIYCSLLIKNNNPSFLLHIVTFHGKQVLHVNNERKPRSYLENEIRMATPKLGFHSRKPTLCDSQNMKSTSYWKLESSLLLIIIDCKVIG